mmetsp:Transcript_106842/g.309055  ORF Transcript_106842/g.309055 Transcript_106842/m.309055 type:complete len:458 (+) Transcript_106842:41-1414(+)
MCSLSMPIPAVAMRRHASCMAVPGGRRGVDPTPCSHSGADATPCTRCSSPAWSTPSVSRSVSRPARVSVVAPGGGTGINAAVYAKLGQRPDFVVDIVGQSRAPYDVYPECWEHGAPAPNLATFAEDVHRQQMAERSDCMVFGSRGGQVVLPTLWRLMGDQMPPSVCINGGCAMNLPQKVRWPVGAVTFLLLGGEDYFRGGATPEEYLAEAKRRVPPGNGTTAILYVSEMQHMPQAALLRSVLPTMLTAVRDWKASGRPPMEELRQLLIALSSDGWTGRLLYTKGPSDWAPAVDFGPFQVTQHVPTRSDWLAEASAPTCAQAVELTHQQELRELFRASVLSAQRGGAAPLVSASDRFHAAAQAAVARAAAAEAAKEAAKSSRARAMLPSAAIGARRSSIACGEIAGGGSPGGGEMGRTRSLYDPTPVSRALGMGRRATVQYCPDFPPELRSRLVSMQA